MREQDTFPIVAMLGRRLERERTGWRDMKALVLLVGHAGDWNAAAQLADALGIAPEQQESIYREVLAERLPGPPPASEVLALTSGDAAEVCREVTVRSR